MNSLFLLLLAGPGFWIGCLLILLAPFACLIPRRRARGSAIALLLAGAILVFASATPLPLWACLLWPAALLIWLIVDLLPRSPRGLRLSVRIAATAVTLLAASIELPWQLPPHFPPVTHHRLYVVGDSISAGLGQPGITVWPALLARRHHIQVVNLSIAGATLAGALRTARQATLSDGLVLLEIGGNDLISSRPAPELESQLEALIGRVSAPGRTVVMLELPAFPGNVSFARIQRRLATRHHIPLIPRRYFLRVLRTRGATLDGIHLSKTGQQQMADLIWHLVGPMLAPAPPTTQPPSNIP